MLQASESHAGGYLILGNLGCVSSFNPTAWIFSALWFASWLWFSDVLSALTKRCFWVANWEAQPIFVLWIFNPFRELTIRPQTHGKSVRFSLIVVLISCSWSFVPFGSIIAPAFRWILRVFSIRFVCSYCTMISGLLARWDHLVFPSVPCLSRCLLDCSQLSFSLFLKVNEQSIGPKNEVTYQIKETHQNVSG